MAIDRTLFDLWADDDGTNTVGTLINKARIADDILDPIDDALAAMGVAGSTTQVIFNDASVLAGDAGLTYNKTTDRLTAAGGFTATAGNSYIGDTANADMAQGLTINQGANDDHVLAFKSSDVGHAVTDKAEGDTFGWFKKVSASEGGLQIGGVVDNASTAAAISLFAIAESDTTKATTSVGALQVEGWENQAGPAPAALPSNANIIVFRNGTTTRFILDTDGDSHQDVGTAWTNFDTHDDVAVLNLLTAYVTQPDDPLRATFWYWLLQSRDTLERLRLVTFNEDGHHFVNMSRLTMLLVGAMRQVGDRVARLESRLLALEA